ncbi:zinc ribbon domain-containing protein [Anaeromassilibacillus senegalensis]|uniref:zinc ribbon domain-containing protein n=1 Tax=Anaeromassilibacillus senegalensis TaxID=1673717 RepID=UPI0006813B3C|nr:zinc ribbon domain-containing protein [Anaeromassilibacillus senegalensis]
MKCRTCGTENPDHANFCKECGTKLRPAISLKKDDPPAFIDRTYTRDSDRPVPAPEPMAESSASTVEPEQTPPSAGAPVFFPSSTSNHHSADLPRSAFSEPPVTGRKTAVPDVLPNPRLAWGEEDDEDEGAEPWYENTWVCIAALFLLFPLGVFLLWKFHKDWGHTVNTVITCSFGAIFAAIILSWSTACFIDYMDSLVIRPEQLQILNGPLTLNLNESEYIDFKITPPNASCDDICFLSTEDGVLLLQQFLDDGVLRGKITATGAGKTYIYLYGNGVKSEAIQISVRNPEELQRKADRFSEKIKSLGPVTLNDALRIKEMLREYNAFPDHIKETIPNVDVLMEAKRTVEQLEKEEQERVDQSIQEVVAAIDQIGDVSLEKQDLVSNARAKCEGLPQSEWSNISNYRTLMNAERAIKELLFRQDFISHCKPVTPSLYKQYLRKPNAYQEQSTHFRGTVFQVVEETEKSSSYLARLTDETGDTDMVICFVYQPGNQPHILEGDLVSVYGTYDGTMRYFTSETTTATVPQITAEIVDVESN